MNVTENALKQFKIAVEQYDKPGSGIRVFAGSGCCGPAVEMRIEDKISPGDAVITLDGVDFFIESKVEQMLSEITIDFRDNGFRLDGLKSSGGCCCG